MLALALMLSAAAGAQAIDWPEGGTEAKAGVRWWWMGSAVDEPNLEYLMNEYARTGIGAVEITPIYGVKGNGANSRMFLSNSWIKMLDKVQQLGTQLGIEIDMNTGTGWPFGGPSVTLDEAAGLLAHRKIDLTTNGTVTQDIALENSTQMAYSRLNRVMAYPLTKNLGDTLDVTSYVNGNTLTWTPPADGKWRIIAVYNSHTRQEVKRPAPGGEGYVLDHLDSAAVAHYLENFEKAFERTGTPWPHTFFNDSYEVYNADWTPRFFEEFEKRRGYRLQNHLQELLGYTTDRATQVRADYRQTMSDLLIDNFTKQWTAWAHKHGAITRNQAHGSPSVLLDTYAAVDIPEIEGYGMSPLNIKGLRKDEGFTVPNSSDFPTLKLAASAAHVEGKPYTSSETMTWLTEHFRTSLSQMKPELDLMFLAGVNHIFFHGTAYSPREAAWPGWKFYASVDMSPTNSIWRDAPSMMQYIERCQRFLQWGQPDNEFLVYMPTSYAWHQKGTTLLKMFPIDQMGNHFDIFERVIDSLDVNGFSSDYASERQLCQLAFDGEQLVTPAGTRYRALQMPMAAANLYLTAETVAHLDTLAQQGATIIWRDRTREAFLQVCNPEPMRSLGLRFIRRSNPTGHHYFIANLTDGDIAAFVPLTVSFSSAALFNPLDGSIRRAETNDQGEIWLSLKSGESIIVQTFTSETAISEPPTVICHEAFTLPLDENIWTLSFIESEPATEKSYTLNGVQTWETLDDTTARLMGTGSYETTFSLEKRQLDEADAGFLLRLGDVRESARVYLNDIYLGCTWSAPFQLPCAHALREGTNTLRIEVTNLPANRIRQMDIDGTQWRIFEDINMSGIVNGSIGVTADYRYTGWQLMPSGLAGGIELTGLKRGDQQSGIRTVGSTELPPTQPVYNLQGQRISHPNPQQLYIQGGRKFIRKR